MTNIPQPIRQTQAPFDTEDDLSHSHQPIQTLKRQSERRFKLLIALSITVSAIAVLYIFSTIGLVKDGLTYREQIMSTEMLPFWAKLAEQEENKNTTALIEEGQHKITRQELGNMGWTLLHMMTGSFPEEITPELRQKWNTFLLLFGHFYPCKLCSSHFLKMQRELTPFNGTKKEQLMLYLCQMHNRVNVRLGKPSHDCSKVKQEWNTCGCSES